jgi:hypothetical protein
VFYRLCAPRMLEVFHCVEQLARDNSRTGRHAVT